ncbi:MAG: IS110 family transposase [Acidimicrobiales bacterium]
MDLDDVEVFVGVDMAKGEHYAQAIASDGSELFDRAISNDQGTIETMIDQAAGIGPVALVIDMTASGAQLLLAVALEREVPVAYVTGLQMRRAAELYAGTAKTDPRDAWVLADFARRNADRLTWLEVSDELLVRLRVLNGRDTDLATDANRVINRCRDALTAVSPALERAVGQRLSQAGIRDVLGRWSTPSALRAAGKTKIRNVIKKRSPRLAAKVTDEIWSALDAQTLTLPAEDTWGEVVTDLTGDLDRIQTRRDELAKTIEEVFLEHPLGQVLVTLCGFGPRTGARTLAEIGDPNRFADGSRLASYAGLSPTDRRSGRSLNTAFQHRGGNHRLKNAMFLAAFVATRFDPDAKAYYQRKRAEGKKHNAAVICVARRRCDLILAMLKNSAPYNPRRHENLPIAA